MQEQQLLTESQIFKNEELSATESTDNPSEEMSEQRDESQDHGQNLTETYRIRPDSKSFILQVQEVLTRDSTKSPSLFHLCHGCTFIRRVLREG